MLVVISPAKNLDFETPLTNVRASQPELLDDAEELVQQLRPLAPHDLSNLMKISDKLGQLNFDRYQEWSRPFTKSNARPAVLTFAGDVYQGLDAQSLSKDELGFAQQHLRILSGLYGVLRPLDLMQAYRLEMGTPFNNNRGANLYQYWGETITEKLNKQLKKLNSDELINLASNEYFKSVKPKSLHANIVEPVFKDWKNGQYKVISFFAKKARGLMSAYIIKNGLTCAEDIKSFDWGGYTLNNAMCEDNRWVFTRKQ